MPSRHEVYRRRAPKINGNARKIERFCASRRRSTSLPSLTPDRITRLTARDIRRSRRAIRLMLTAIGHSDRRTTCSPDGSLRASGGRCVASFAVGCAILPSPGLSAGGPRRQPGAQKRPDAPQLAPYVPTPQEVVDRMLRLAARRQRATWSTTWAVATAAFRSPPPRFTARAASASTSTRSGSPRPTRTPSRRA